MFNKKILGYVEKADTLLPVKAVDIIEQTVTLVDEDGETAVIPMSEVELLQELGEFQGRAVFNRDVFQRKDDKLIEVELQDDGTVVFHVLNDKLERELSGTKVDAQTTFDRIDRHATLIANIYELEVIEEEAYDFNFNIKVVKDYNGQFYTYYYACNNKQNEEIDLIKVVFVGHNLIEEEDYIRKTVSYEEFAELVHTQELEDVSQQELANYAYGVLAGVNNVEEDDFEEDFEEEDWEEEDLEQEEEESFDYPTTPKELTCDCGETFKNCTCSPW
jgi:hypothetical protein